MATSHPPSCTPLPWFLEGTNNWTANPLIPIKVTQFESVQLSSSLVEMSLPRSSFPRRWHRTQLRQQPSQDEGFDLQEKDRDTSEFQKSIPLIRRRFIDCFVELQPAPIDFEEYLQVGLSSTNTQIGSCVWSKTYPIQAHQWNLNPHLRKRAAHRSCRTFTAPRYSSFRIRPICQHHSTG
jgi:hypothetical protein